MLNKSAIICEYNPLHNGHIKHIEYTKNKCDILICIMSGNFTQRGMPAILNKYIRASHAVNAGADIVIELPTIFAVSAAANFAYGGVRIAQQLNCDILSFGSECGNIDKLIQVSQITDDHLVIKHIKENLSNGNTYAKSVADAACIFDQDNILDSPNNLLAIEYIRACKSLNYKPKLMTIKRDSNFNSLEIKDICSATAIRQACINNKSFETVNSIPDYVYHDLLLCNYKNIQNNYYIFAHSFLNTCTKQYLYEIEGVSEGLENRMINCLTQPDYLTMLAKLKTKRYTMARLERIVINSILNINKQLMIKAKTYRQLPIKVLAVNSNKLQLLQDINNITNSELDLITNKADKLYASLSNSIYDIEQNTNLNKVNVK